MLISQNKYKLQDQFCLTGNTAVNYQHLSTSWFQSYNIWLPEYYYYYYCYYYYHHHHHLKHSMRYPSLWGDFYLRGK